MMKTKNIDVLILSINDPFDKKTWSGIPHYLIKSIQPYFKSIKILDSFDKKQKLLLPKLKNKAKEILYQKRFDFSHSKELALIYKDHFEMCLNKNKGDLIISIVASTAVSYLETKVPLVHISDATFMKMINYYPAYTNLSKKSILEGNEIEHNTLSKSLINVFPSEWAMQSAIEDYNTAPSKNFCIPFGANIDSDPKVTTHHKNISDKVNLLFLGVDWNRKGGDIALQSYYILKKKNIPVSLTVCGCKIPYSVKDPNVINIPYVDKNKPDDYRQFLKLLDTAHFLILPTKSECFGIVFCEASAFGVPSLTYKTGGVPSAIIHESNGILLDISDGADVFADKIEFFHKNPDKYAHLSKSSRSVFESRLNWDVWAKKFVEILETNTLC